MNQRIFVTGATGFLGRHVVRRLLGEGRQLRLAVRQADRCPSEWRQHRQIEIVPIGALEAATDLSTRLGGVAAVVHMAGLAHVAGEDEGALRRANAEATAHLCEAAREAGVAAFIHVSSIAAVSDNDFAGVIDDAISPAPVTAYGRSKRQTEIHVEALARAGTMAISLRPPLIVGADAPGNWGSLQRLCATRWPLPFASVAARRAYVSTATMAQAVAALCSMQPDGGLSGNYCICDPDMLRLPELVRELRAGMDLPPTVFPFPPAILSALGSLAGRRRQMAGLTGNLVIDPSRFFARFGLSPQLPIRQAVGESGREFAASRQAV